jgi:hypothetical protein
MIEKIGAADVSLSELCASLPAKDHDDFFIKISNLLKSTIEAFSTVSSEKAVSKLKRL